MHDHDDDGVHDTPPAVIAAVAAGTGPLPFLAVYAVMFIVHGGFHHVVPPDVTNSNTGELWVGIGCAVGFLVGLTVLLWLLNGTRRWPFVLVEAAFLALSLILFIDPTTGGRVVSGLVVVTSFVGLVLSAHPQAWDHVGRRCPGWLARAFGRRPARTRPMPAGSSPASDTLPTSARSVGHTSHDT